MGKTRPTREGSVGGPRPAVEGSLRDQSFRKGQLWGDMACREVQLWAIRPAWSAVRGDWPAEERNWGRSGQVGKAVAGDPGLQGMVANGGQACRGRQFVGTRPAGEGTWGTRRAEEGN